MTLSKVSFLKVSKWPKKSFLRISENDTFESVILESVNIESVGVDVHCHRGARYSFLTKLKVSRKFPLPCPLINTYIFNKNDKKTID